MQFPLHCFFMLILSLSNAFYMREKGGGEGETEKTCYLV